MRNFSLVLREQAEKINNYELAEIISLTKEDREWHRQQIVRYICNRVN